MYTEYVFWFFTPNCQIHEIPKQYNYKSLTNTITYHVIQTIFLFNVFMNY